jgi:hypothetical protein
MIPVSTVVTKNCIKEYLICKYSFEQFHDSCVWYVSCDEYTSDFLKNLNFNNVKILQFNIDDKNSNHNSENKNSKQTFFNIILNKFVSIERCIEENGYTLFLDCDMLFVNKIETNIIQMLKNKNVDFITTPHYTNNISLIEDKYGFYNVGMFGLNDLNNLKNWKSLTLQHEELNLYYEQKPFELIMKNYLSLNLPINYNIGWWRFNQPNTVKRMNQLTVENNELYFGTLKAINFHFHLVKQPDGYNPGKNLIDKVLYLLNVSENEKYIKILEYYESISKRSI